MPTTETTRTAKELLLLEIERNEEGYRIFLKSPEIYKIIKSLFSETATIGSHSVFWDDDKGERIMGKIYGWGSSFYVGKSDKIILPDTNLPNLLPLFDAKIANGVEWTISLSDSIITRKELNMWTTELERVAKYLYNIYGEEYKKVVRIMVES